MGPLCFIFGRLMITICIFRRSLAAFVIPFSSSYVSSFINCGIKFLSIYVRFLSNFLVNVELITKIILLSNISFLRIHICLLHVGVKNRTVSLIFIVTWTLSFILFISIRNCFLFNLQFDLSCRNTKQNLGAMFTRTNYVTLKYVTDGWGTDSNGFKLIVTAVKDPSKFYIIGWSNILYISGLMNSWYFSLYLYVHNLSHKKSQSYLSFNLFWQRCGRFISCCILGHGSYDFFANIWLYLRYVFFNCQCCYLKWTGKFSFKC